MLQQDVAKDYVIATGEQHSVRDFVDMAGGFLDMKITWDGEGVEELGRDAQGSVVVAIDPRYYRPTEVNSLLGDASKGRAELGWKPH